MNYYQQLYDSLIHHSCPLPNTLKETHHVIPRCMGGSNSKNNLVDLPTLTHLYAHYLLSKAYPNVYGLRIAFWMMSNQREWQWLPDECILEIEHTRNNHLKGSLHPSYGKKQSKDTLEKQMKTKGIPKYSFYHKDSETLRVCYPHELIREFPVLDFRLLHKVYSGERYSHGGWYCFPEDVSIGEIDSVLKTRERSNFYNFFCCATGEEFYGSATMLAREYPEVSQSGISLLLSGRINHSKDWIVAN